MAFLGYHRYTGNADDDIHKIILIYTIGCNVTKTIRAVHPTMQMADKATHLGSETTEKYLECSNRIHEQPQTRHPPNQTRCIYPSRVMRFSSIWGVSWVQRLHTPPIRIRRLPKLYSRLTYHYFVRTLNCCSHTMYLNLCHVYSTNILISTLWLKYRHQTISNVYMPCQPMSYSGTLWIPLGPPLVSVLWELPVYFQ